MASLSSQIVRVFYERKCVELMCWLDEIQLGRASISRLRECLAGKRRNLPYSYATFYGVERKDGVGVVAKVLRSRADHFGTYVRWFRVTSGPPEQYGKFSDYLSMVSSAVGSREAGITATLSYELDKVQSLFSPIQMEAPGGIFDEFVGFTGIKRTPDGKRLYSLEVNLDDKTLEHKVGFSHTIQLSEELPLGLLDIATRISNLALKKRE